MRVNSPQGGFTEVLLDAAAKGKGYASFFDWPNKPVKERGIVCDLLESIRAENGAHGIAKLWSNPNRYQTPDIIARGMNGEAIAFEVTELVDQATVEQKKRGAG